MWIALVTTAEHLQSHLQNRLIKWFSVVAVEEVPVDPQGHLETNRLLLLLTGAVVPVDRRLQQEILRIDRNGQVFGAIQTLSGLAECM